MQFTVSSNLPEPKRLGAVSQSLTALRFVAALLLLALGPTMVVRGGTPESAFDEANKLYEQGKYSEAASGYQKILQSGQASAAVLYNLGNAFFKSGQLGRAIAIYRRAQQVTPRDPDLRANLLFARNQTQGPTLAMSKWEGWLRRLTLNEWTLLAVVGLWVSLVLLAIQEWRPRWKSVLRNYVLIVGLATILSFVGVGAAIYQQYSGGTAVVITSEAPLHNGPLDESPAPVTLHDGAEVRVLDHKDAWVQVSPDPLRIGWVRRDQIVFAGAGADSLGHP
jgi:tetratricopeptide (TPR) repeat protein